MKMVFLVIFLFGCIFNSFAFAQSTLEYSILSESLGAAGAAAARSRKSNVSSEKTGVSGAGGIVSEAATQVYESSAQVISRGTSLLGQVGRPQASGGGLGLPVVGTGKEEKTHAIQAQKESIEKALVQTDSDRVKLFLKDGSIIRGELRARTAKYVTLLIAGAEVTYFREEFYKIEEDESS